MTATEAMGASSLAPVAPHPVTTVIIMIHKLGYIGSCMYILRVDWISDNGLLGWFSALASLPPAAMLNYFLARTRFVVIDP